MTYALANSKKSKGKKKKSRAAKKRRQRKLRDKGVDPTKEGNVIAEMMLRRRMGTGGSGAHEPQRKALERASRRQEKQHWAGQRKDWSRDNPARKPKLKTFKAGRTSVRWRPAASSMPSSAGHVDESGVRWVPSDGDYLWVGYTIIPPGVRTGHGLSDLEALGEAFEPDVKAGQWSQHVMIARTHLEPRLWKRSTHEWKGPDPDRFHWQQAAPYRRGMESDGDHWVPTPDASTRISIWAAVEAESDPHFSGVTTADLNSLKPGQAKFKIHKTYALAQKNPVLDWQQGSHRRGYRGQPIPTGLATPSPDKTVSAKITYDDVVWRLSLVPRKGKGWKAKLSKRVRKPPAKWSYQGWEDRTVGTAFFPTWDFDAAKDWAEARMGLTGIEALASLGLQPEWSESQKNPSRYGSTTHVGHAEHEVQKQGFDDIVFVKKGAIAYGPVLVFTATQHRQHYNITVGRWNRTDRLDVRASRAQTDPQLGGGATQNPFIGGTWYPETKVKRTPPPRKKKLRSPPLYPTPRQNPGYRSAVISKPSAAQLGGNPARRNPGVLSDYDPREEQMRAQTAKIFRTKVEKGEDPRAAASSAFAIATGQGQRYGWYYPGTRTPTPRAAKASQQRYDGTYVGSDRKRRTLDDLIRNRQTYEKILGLTRQSGFYRVTEEPTREGKRYFVWPMPPGERTPGPAATARRIAETQAERLNRTADPRDTGRWPGELGGYTKAELSYWLPPAETFSTKGLPSVAPKKGRKPSRKGPRRGTPTPRPVPDFSLKGEMREGQLVYFIVDKAGKQTSPEFPDWDRAWTELQRRVS
jgi:hypothetical protein